MVINRIHQGMGDGLIPLAHGRQVQLPFQVVLERFGGGVTGFEVVVVFVVVTGC